MGHETRWRIRHARVKLEQRGSYVARVRSARRCLTHATHGIFGAFRRPDKPRFLGESQVAIAMRMEPASSAHPADSISITSGLLRCILQPIPGATVAHLFYE